MLLCCSIYDQVVLYMQRYPRASNTPLVLYHMNYNSIDSTHDTACLTGGAWEPIVTYSNAQLTVPLYYLKLGLAVNAAANVTWSLPYQSSDGMGMLVTISLPVYTPSYVVPRFQAFVSVVSFVSAFLPVCAWCFLCLMRGRVLLVLALMCEQVCRCSGNRYRAGGAVKSYGSSSFLFDSPYSL